MSDLIDRLSALKNALEWPVDPGVVQEAIDALTEKDRQIQKLREALCRIVNWKDFDGVAERMRICAEKALERSGV